MTTNVIKKIGATNTPTVMDYSSLSTWAAACPANLITVDQCWIGEVYNQGEISVSGVLLSATGDTTRKVILRAATGQGFKDNAPAALRYNAANGAAIVITGGYDTLFGVTGSVAIEVQGLQLRSSVTNSGVLAFPSPSTTGVLVHECIISTSGNNHNGVNAVASFRGGIYSNNLFIHEGAGSGGQLLSISTNNTGLLVVNNTFVVTGTAGGTAIYSQYSGPAIYNNAFFGLIPPLDFGTTGTGTNNITDQASWGTNAPASPGTTGAAFTTANFNAVSGVTNGAGTGWDLRIPTGSALKDTGSTVNGSSIDILGTSRPQNTITDIGAYEFVVTGLTGSVSNTAATGDSITASLRATGSVSDTATTGDSRTSSLIATGAVSDAAATGESTTAILRSTASISDAATTGDALTAAAQVAGAITEAATTADAITASLTASAAISEAASSADAYSGSASGAYTASLTEASTAADAITASLSATASITEAASSADAYTGTAAGAYTASLTESAASSDSITAGLAASAFIIEAAAAVDVVSGTASGTYAVSLIESAIVVDALSITVQASATLTESAVALDVLGAATAGNYIASLTEGAATSDAIAATGRMTAALIEAAATGDRLALGGATRRADFFFGA